MNRYEVVFAEAQAKALQDSSNQPVVLALAYLLSNALTYDVRRTYDLDIAGAMTLNSTIIGVNTLKKLASIPADVVNQFYVRLVMDDVEASDVMSGLEAGYTMRGMFNVVGHDVAVSVESDIEEETNIRVGVFAASDQYITFGVSTNDTTDFYTPYSAIAAKAFVPGENFNRSRHILGQDAIRRANAGQLPRGGVTNV